MGSKEFQPSHAYIPGLNKRHAEGLFDHIRDTAKSGMSAKVLAQSEAFQTGLRFIEEQYFWEAHEVLEPVWMLLEKFSDERHFVQGLIQLANGLLKMRMNRPKAAHRLAIIALSLVSLGKAEFVMNVKREDFILKIRELEHNSKLQYNA